MNVLSLFDGISCGQLALHNLGIKVDNYFASEIDKYAIDVAKKNFPNTVHVGDVCNIAYSKYRDCLVRDWDSGYISNLPNSRGIDLVIAGSPCQGFSTAGKQLNFADPRSVLFFEFARLLDECNPTYFLLENVRMKQEWQDIITDILGVEPITINSSLVSAQNRNRLYWTNIPQSEELIDHNITLPDILESGDACDLVINQGKEAKVKEILKGSCLLARDYKGFGNQGQTGVRVIDGTKSWRTLTPTECERMQTIPDGYTSMGATKPISKTQRLKMLGNCWTIKVIEHLFKGLI